MAAILAVGGNGGRPMVLARPRCSSERAYNLLKATTARPLFPQSRSPEAALAGLYLYFGCWNEAHEIAQEVETSDGSYWHAIVHRQEPDAGNSAYWFRQTGEHPVFPALAKLAGVERWDPIEFIRQCERNHPRASDLQLAEWQLLFDYCAKASGR